MTEMDKVECKELIVARIKRCGNGTIHSPIRIITEVYEKDGTLIAENDPNPETFVPIDLIHFARWVNKLGLDFDLLDSKVVAAWLDTTISKSENKLKP